jgi:hypothetical protein
MKKILLVGMVDSVHTARWIERIVDLDCEIHLLPSRKHGEVHPLLRQLIDENHNLRLLQSFHSVGISPYLNFLIGKINFSFFNLQNWLLRRILSRELYSYIHLLEIQHAGYLLIEARPAITDGTKIICTNWGSDIYYFSQFDSHLKKIREVLSIANFYSAECERDYALAKKFGFRGEELPLIPNSFKLNSEIEIEIDCQERNQVIAKCYGGIFGLGGVLISVLNQFLEEYLVATVLLYSVTDDLLNDARRLEQKFPNRVRISTIRNPMTSNQIAAEFQQSRIYIGASRSDGISTSFLEAMNYGAFPIQTNTSCAQDWISKGCVGRVVEPEREALFSALSGVYDNVEEIRVAIRTNLTQIKQYADSAMLKEVSKSFYS